METQPGQDGERPAESPGESTESILEALLVEDAELRWDPRSGKARVRRRPKAELDRTIDSA